MFEGEGMLTYSVYFLKAGDYIKIGLSKDVHARIESFKTSNPYKIKIVGIMPHLTKKRAFEVEKKLHNYFSHIRSNREWFCLPNFSCYDHETETIVDGDGGIHINSIIGDNRNG